MIEVSGRPGLSSRGRSSARNESFLRNAFILEAKSVRQMSYRIGMSFVHRRAGVLFSALVATLLLACGDDRAARGGGGGGDDDDDGAGSTADAGGGGAPDSGGGAPDASGGRKDAGGTADGGTADGGSDKDAGGASDAGDIDGGAAPDAGDLDGGAAPDAGQVDAGTPDAGEPDAGADPFDGEFLLSLVAPAVNPNNPIRFIATVDFTQGGGGAGTADFSFQPIIAPECTPDSGGLPVGDAVVVTGVPISAQGTFDISLSGATLPGQANPLPIPGIMCTDLPAQLDVAGAIVSTDLTCGTITALGSVPGTFGAIRIPPGTVGDANLPDAVTACP